MLMRVYFILILVVKISPLIGNRHRELELLLFNQNDIEQTS